MRTITTDTQSRINAQSGEECVCILKLILGTETLWLSDRETTEGGILMLPLIQAFSDLKTQVRIDGVDRWLGTVGVINFTLLDEDESLRTRLESTPLQGSAAEVYFAFSGQAQSDWTLLLKGKVQMPGAWGEDDRTLSLTVETPRRDEEVPHTPDVDSGEVDEQFEGQTWPMMFGDAIRDGRAQQVAEPPTSRLVADTDQDATTFVVEEADELFPQDTQITLQVGDEWITGSFSGEDFTVTTRQVDRVTGSGLSGTGAEINLPIGVRAVGTYIEIKRSIDPASDSLMVGYCHEQEGQVARIFNGNSSFTISATYSYQINRYPFTPAQGARWTHKGGTTVTQMDVPAIYVASEVPLSNVIRVRAWRQVTNDDTGYSRRELVTVDPAHYTVTLADSSYRGTTTITFSLPLGARGAGWEDVIYVSAASSVGSNTADIIEWLVENRSDLDVDTASFATVRAQIDKYPMNFTRHVSGDVLDLAADIAWQARCGVTWNGSAVVLRYLSAEPSSTDLELNNTTLAEGEIIQSATPITDLTTIFVAEWQRDGKDEGDPRTLTYRNNVDLYGRRRKVFDFWAYQKRSLVKKSAAFWAARYSRSWRRMTVGLWGFEALGIDPLDYANWNLSDFYATVAALVLAATVRERDTKLHAELPIEAGTTTQSSDYWTSDSETKPPTPDIPLGQPEIEKVSAEAPPAITFSQDPTNTFSVVAVTNEVSIASSSTFKTVDVRIRGTSEQEISSQIATNLARIAEIDVLDPSGVNAALQAERAALVSENAALNLNLMTAEEDGEIVTATNGEVNFMRIGDTGIMVKVPGGGYFVTPDNATGPHIATVTQKPSSPAQGILYGDIASTIQGGPTSEVVIEIIGDGSGIEVDDQLLVHRDASGAFYSIAPGGARRAFMGRVDEYVSTNVTTQRYLVTLDTGEQVTASQQLIAPDARLISGTYVTVVKEADDTYSMQVPVWRQISE